MEQCKEDKGEITSKLRKTERRRYGYVKINEDLAGTIYRKASGNIWFPFAKSNLIWKGLFCMEQPNQNVGQRKRGVRKS